MQIDKRCRKRQSGMALVLMVIIIALAMSTYYFNTISVVEIKIENKQQTREALKQAKQALIDYAITNADGAVGNPGRYGFLPCPQNATSPSEGAQGGNCGARAVNTIGYFPWGSTDSPIFKDGTGNCLWYAVNGRYKNSPPSGLVNEDTEGLFQIVDTAGTLLQDDVLAVVFAPGATLDGQVRVFDDTTHCGMDNGNMNAYLEGDGVRDNATLTGIANTVDQFIHETLTSATEVTPYNDNLITITRQDIWPAIMNRADIQTAFEESTEALAQCLAEYVNHASNDNNRVPWPAPMDIDTVDADDFQIMDNYSDKVNATSGYAGRFPFHIDDSNTVIVTPISDDLLDDAICENMNLPSGLLDVDLPDIDDKHRRIIENWKDHFFLATSLDYSVTVAGPTPESAVPAPLPCGNCVSIGGTEYAAIVFFSNSPIINPPALTQVRTDAGKLLYNNHLENGNDADFPDNTGDAVYATAAAMPTSNDIMYCLTTSAARQVVPC